jgi:outer membrane immunogenic protein
VSCKQGCFLVGVAMSALAANSGVFAADAPAPSPLYSEASYPKASYPKASYPKASYPKTPPDGSSHDWTGCYAGLNGGGGTMADSFTTSPFNGSVNGGGGVAGGQVGCNTQIGQLVFGIEGEGTWSDLVDRASLRQPGFSVQIATRNSWSADLAARAGVAIDRTLIYVKFGIASGGFDFSATNTNPLIDNGSGTLVGPLLGGGIEVAFAPHWSAKLEYDHIGYVGRSVQFSGSDFGVNLPINQSQSASANLVKAGLNYQFGDSSAAAAGRHALSPLYTKAAQTSRTYDWTGCYVGVHGGGGTRIDSFNDINGGGGLAGGQLGCNTQIGQLVLGIEGESAWANLVDRSQFDLAGSSQQSTTRNSWSADLAARAGVAIDRALIYTKIGIASGGFGFSFSATPQTENGSGTLAGLLLGGGIEVAVAPHWSAGSNMTISTMWAETCSSARLAPA